MTSFSPNYLDYLFFVISSTDNINGITENFLNYGIFYDLNKSKLTI
jgi:hypothetical protein